MTLKEMFETVMKEYHEVKGTKYGRENPLFTKWKNLRTNIIKEIIANSKLDFTTTYTSDLQKNGTASVPGSGGWGYVFGVSIRDKRITAVSGGVYITYMFNMENRDCYLTLAQGAREYNKSTLALATRVNDLRSKLSPALVGSGFDTTTKPDSGKGDYDAGVIAYKKYTLATLPDDAGLYADLGAMEKVYRYYLDNVYPSERAGASTTEDTAEAADEDETDLELTMEMGTAAEDFTAYDYADPCIKTGGKNLIIYGTPGCGKSYKLDSDLKAIGKDEKFRVTFHPDYTYTDFVGQVMPVATPGKTVVYQFVPGPFTAALKTAIANKAKEVVLVIEEINRGNAASIFGDLFQLLDRDSNGTSQYELTNIQITDHLKNELDYHLNYIKIPSNLSIYATMNTGDQNVFTLDTAFKRRWDFEKLSNLFRGDETHKDRYIPGMSNVTWENFVKAINEHMIGSGTLDSEDKQLGKYFITYSQLVDFGEKDTAKNRKFAFKVLEYLWNDVAKFDRDRWFKTGNYKTLDEVIEEWVNGNGEKVFNDKLKFTETKPVAAVGSTTAGADEE